MLNDLVKSTKGRKVVKRPEKNRRFGSVQEYLSQLKKSYTLLPEKIIILTPENADWKEKAYNKIHKEIDFVNYIQCLDNWIENDRNYEWKELKEYIDSIQSKEDFYMIINKVYSSLPYHSYDIENKRIVLNDYKLERISKSITGLNMYKVWEIRKHISEDVWKYLMYACKEVYSQALYSKCYEYWMDIAENYFFDGLEEDGDGPDDEYYRDSLRDMTGLTEMVALFPDEKPVIKKRKLSDLEKGIIECCNRIINFDRLDIMPLLNPDDYKEMGWYDDEEKDLWESYLDESTQCVIDEFINGQFVPIYSHPDSHVDILENYVEQVNMYEQEGQWLVTFDNSIVITKDHIDFGNEARNKMIDYHDAFYELKELMKC